MADITILGCGFGAALAVMLDANGHNVTAWSKYPDEIETINSDREQKKLLPGVKLPESVKFTADPSCVKGADIVICAIPSAYVRDGIRAVKAFVDPKSVILNVGKGLEESTYNRLSQVIKEELPDNPIAVMAGPCHAEEVGRLMPTTVVVAAESIEISEYVQDTMMNPVFRIYVSEDMIGCEIASALKNPIALCCGIVEGLGLGDNTLAALMTRGLTEITRLGVAMGAEWETFTGLAGVGDLIVTCTSMHSRNHRAGLLIGKGEDVKKAVAMVGTVEGYGICKIVHSLAQLKGVQMPITEQLYSVCFEGTKPEKSIPKLMNRSGKHEKEPFWN